MNDLYKNVWLWTEMYHNFYKNTLFLKYKLFDNEEYLLILVIVKEFVLRVNFFI